MESAGLEIYSNLLSEIAINTWENMDFQAETVINTWENTEHCKKNTPNGSKIVSRAPLGPLGDPSGNWHLFWTSFWIDFDHFLTDFGGPGDTKFLIFLDIFSNAFSIPHPQPSLGGFGLMLAPFWKPFQGHFQDLLEYNKINDFAAIYYTLTTL